MKKLGLASKKLSRPVLPPTQVVPRDTVERALAASLSPNQRSGITDEAVDLLWSSCIAAQANCISNPLRKALFSATGALWKALDATQTLVESVIDIRSALIDRQSGWNDDIGISAHFETVTGHSLTYRDQQLSELREISSTLEALKGLEVLAVRKLDAKQDVWRGVALSLAADFLKAAENVTPKPGHISPPAKFLSAIMPHITGEIGSRTPDSGHFTIGAVRQHLATKEPSQPRAKRDDFLATQKKSATRQKSKKGLSKQRQ